MTLHNGRFAGRVALVTGAAGGIGRAIAVRLAGEGATVVVADRDGDGAVATVAEIARAGGRAHAEVVDLAVAGERATLVGRVLGATGRVDVLVNNAATLGAHRTALELDEDDWTRVLATNLTAVAFLSRDAARDMATRGAGAIVNLASLHEVLPVPGRAAYGATKGGVAALTRSFAADLATHGIRVNAVLPGMIDSASMTRSLTDAGAGTRPPSTLLRRLGTPAEVAGVVAYLASDDAAYVTAAVWRVDGGRAVSRLPDPLIPDPHDSSED